MSWKKNLSYQQKQEIHKLLQVNPMWNLVVLVFIAMWILAAWTLLNTNFLALRILCYIAIGTSVHAMANMMHEGSHGNLFRNRKLDKWFSFALVIPAFISASAYKVTHMFHHRYTRTEDDPDEFKNVSSNKVLQTLAFYFWILIGSAVYIVHIAVTALTRGRKYEKKEVIIEYALLLVIYFFIFLTAIKFHFVNELLHCWLIPLFVAISFGNIRGWAEHTMTEPGNDLIETRTVTSNKILSFLNINLNYHLEHHLYPTMPWYNLPKLHLLLQDEYRKAGTFIYKSYFVFLYDAFRTGVHGYAPPNRKKSEVLS